LTITPVDGLIGDVVLNCSAIVIAPNATCSMQPSMVTLSGASQAVTVTINTLISAELRPHAGRGGLDGITLCILAPAAFS